MANKSLRKNGRKKISYRTLVCSARGTRLAMTVPQKGDPTPVIYIKACRVFEVWEDSFNLIIEDLNGVLSFIEETDFAPEEEILGWD